MEISIRHFKYVWEDIREVIAIGSSSFFRSAFAVVAAVSINRVAGSFSTAALAALSVANRVMEFPFGQGYQPVVGFNWGAKAWKRVKESFSFSCMVSLVGAVVIGGLIAVFATPIVHAFNREADTEVLRLGLLCIRLQCLALPIHALSSIINMFYAGIGQAKNALIINLARQGYCFFPALFVAPLLMGINGVAATQAIADMLSILVVIPLGLKALRMISEKERS